MGSLIKVEWVYGFLSPWIRARIDPSVCSGCKAFAATERSDAVNSL
jgi:hypothetical protein